MNSISNIFQSLRLTNSKTSTYMLTATPESFSKNSTVNDTSIITNLREISLSEVADHDDFYDCWIVIYDNVYNVTKFLRSHPGGEDVIMDYAGRDATLAFRGTGHSKDAIDLLKDFQIGTLPEKERIFRTMNGRVLQTDIPE